MAPKTIELTKKQRSEVKLLSQVLTIEQMASYFGISERTFRDMMGRDPTIRRDYAMGRAMIIQKIGSSLVRRALDGDVRAIEFYLRTQAGWRHADEVKTKYDGNIAISVVTGVPREGDPVMHGMDPDKFEDG